MIMDMFYSFLFSLASSPSTSPPPTGTCATVCVFRVGEGRREGIIILLYDYCSLQPSTPYIYIVK